MGHKRLYKIMAEKDATQTQLTSSNFQLQVCTAILYNVMGITDVGSEDDNKDENNVAKNN